MYKLRGAALKWKDPEGVHSMRVATRRLRSALSDFMPYMEGRSLSTTIKQIRSIADALGRVRDQDVAISAIETLLVQTSVEFSTTLEKLIDERKNVRRHLRQELRKTLAKETMSDLSASFSSALELAAQQIQEERTYKKVASAIIRDRLRELEKLSVSLYQPLGAAELHEMRIAAKRLRYAIERFAVCWDSETLTFAKSSARLQSALGSLHDCDVWLEDFRREILNSKRLRHEEQIKTFVWLFKHYNELRNTYFAEAFSLWDEWERDDLSGSLKRTLKR